jgi:S-adenosylmethionine synthetase
MKTAESVAIGHPDKVCDQISDAILDACLAADPKSRAAIETMGGHGIITITGELSTHAYVDIRDIARKIYRECGYADEIGVQTNIVMQSPEIAKGVDQGGAGDQGIMIGYATAETPELMPLEVMLSRKLTRLMPSDGKSQVTTENGKVTTVITSVCGEFDWTILEKIVKTFPLAHNFAWRKNPNGSWMIGGFNADTGLTGRKLAVDNYGPDIPLGGGCFSGKDATKVDRSGAYITRKIACDYVRKGATEVKAKVAYAIGVADPVMAVVEIDGKEEKVTGYDLHPQAIIDFLELRKPIFRETAKYGHFGNGFKWD